MRRSAPWTLAVAVVVVLSASLVSPLRSSQDPVQVETKTVEKKAETPPPTQPPEKAVEKGTLELRILATKKHDAEAIEKANAPDGLKNPPRGYRWVRIAEKAGLASGDTIILRDGPIDGGGTAKFVLVKLDRQNVSETDLARLAAALDERKLPAIDFRLTPSGARRLGRLTREHLPEDDRTFKHRLAVVIDGIVRSAPTINSEVREGGMIEGIEASEVETIVNRLKKGSVDARAHDDGFSQFRDAKFGLSLRWGLSAIPGKGERIGDDPMPAADVEKLAAKFNPDAFNADLWAKAAKDAGAKYLTVTAKGPDGFCLFDSKLTNYDVVDTSAYAKDPIKPLAEACRKNNIKLFFSYSLPDRHHADFGPPGGGAKPSEGSSKGDWKSYVRYYQGQIRELCTDYGDIGGIRFEGARGRPDTDWDFDATCRLIHELQPAALALIERDTKAASSKPSMEVEFLAHDEGLPAGSAASESAVDGPREVLQTLDNSRGYNESDKSYKPADLVVPSLVATAGRGANLSLEVGPMANGALPKEATEKLVEVGKWLAKNGDAIYATRPGPIAPQDWGLSLKKGDVVYLHILKSSDRITFALPGDYSFDRAELFGGRKASGFGFGTTKTSGTVDGKPIDESSAFVQLSADARTPIDTIVVLRPPGAKTEEPKKTEPPKKEETKKAADATKKEAN